jgi:hypothetical protein
MAIDDNTARKLQALTVRGFHPGAKIAANSIKTCT